MAKFMEREVRYSTGDLQFQHKVFPKSSTDAIFVELFYDYLMHREGNAVER